MTRLILLAVAVSLVVGCVGPCAPCPEGPQGKISAVVGAIYRAPDGQRWVKVRGHGTRRGWRRLQKQP